MDLKKGASQLPEENYEAKDIKEVRTDVLLRQIESTISRDSSDKKD